MRFSRYGTKCCRALLRHRHAAAAASGPCAPRAGHGRPAGAGRTGREPSVTALRANRVWHRWTALPHAFAELDHKGIRVSTPLQSNNKNAPLRKAHPSLDGPRLAGLGSWMRIAIGNSVPPGWRVRLRPHSFPTSRLEVSTTIPLGQPDSRRGRALAHTTGQTEDFQPSPCACPLRTAPTAASPSPEPEDPRPVRTRLSFPVPPLPSATCGRYLRRWIRPLSLRPSWRLVPRGWARPPGASGRPSPQRSYLGLSGHGAIMCACRIRPAAANRACCNIGLPFARTAPDLGCTTPRGPIDRPLHWQSSPTLDPYTQPS